MSQFQSPTTVSSATSQRGNGTENTAQNASVNDPRLKTSPTASSDAGYRALDEGHEIAPKQEDKEGLPEQKHAGTVGYGPNYASENKVSLGDKFTGIKEQVVGKVTNNPELVQRGHDRKTGEIKRKEREEHETNLSATFDDQESTSPSSTDAGAFTRTGTGNDSTRGVGSMEEV